MNNPVLQSVLDAKVAQLTSLERKADYLQFIRQDVAQVRAEIDVKSQEISDVIEGLEFDKLKQLRKVNNDLLFALAEMKSRIEDLTKNLEKQTKRVKELEKEREESRGR
jgi:septal ring factor EnvC (AmiA/AmiB activator)